MLAFVVTVPAGEVELASDALWALGVVAVEERTSGHDDPAGTLDRLVELWTSLGDDVDAVTRAAEAFPSRWRWRLVEVDARVAETWRQHAVPSWVTPDLVVAPAWLDVEFPADITVVRIEPGATFGLGDHPTTVLTLRALHGVLWPDATVLDVGCGSGVLAVTAAVLGSPYTRAIDVSPAAVEATIDNAVRNGVLGAVEVDNTPVSEIVGPFDVVLANILAPELISMADDLRRLTAPAGVLVVSGLLADGFAQVVDALAPMQVVDRLTREGWAALVLRH
jgi:ribosomal protein L11 methyltransferase